MTKTESTAIKVFETARAPDKEVEDVRALLKRNRIRFYETPRENFGISSSAIWVYCEKDFKNALQLINEYQVGLVEKTRKIGAQKKPRKSRWFRNDVLFLILVLIILAWMYVTGSWRP